MKTYTVYSSEPVTMKHKGDRFNKESKKREHDADCEETSPMFTFRSPAPAKKPVKENMDKYTDSVMTKTRANGDRENPGPIKLSGNNKTFVANTGQKAANYQVYGKKG